MTVAVLRLSSICCFQSSPALIVAVVPGLDHAMALEQAEVFQQLLAQGFIAVRIGEKELDGLKGGLDVVNILALPVFNPGFERHQFVLNARIARTHLPGTLTDAPAGIALRTT